MLLLCGAEAGFVYRARIEIVYSPRRHERRETIGEWLNNSNNFNHPVKWVEPTLGFQKRGGGRDGAMEGGKGSLHHGIFKTEGTVVKLNVLIV